MENQKIFQLIQDVFTSLEESGVIKEHINLSNETVLIGPNAVLDSIAFVTLFVDLEERLGECTDKEVYLLVDEIHKFNPQNSFLTVGVLIDYIKKLFTELV